MRIQGWRFALLTLPFAAATAAAQAEDPPAADGAAPREVAIERAVAANGARDPDSHRWSVHVDDDLFAFTNRDRDYTAGVTFNLTGEPARNHPLSLARALAWADGASRFAAWRGEAATQGEALELGLLLFTPQNLSAAQPLPDDRPYANLLYAASSQLALDDERNVAYQSSLAIGFLGLPFAGALHRTVHEIIGSTEPRGYSHEISDGGEPTFMYAVSRYRLLRAGSYRGHPYSLRFGAGGTLGYLTEANIEITARTDAPWWSSSTASGDYAGHPPIGGPSLPAHRGPRLQLEAGAKIHLRLYNAFLEGQVRHSDVTLAPHELNPVLVDLWVGATTMLANGVSISYTIRHQTQEIATGRGARSFSWGSIGIAQRF
jgi:hypothetical protein